MDTQDKNLEEGHLFTSMAVEFGIRAKLFNGKRIVALDWLGFQMVARYFYELGKEANNNG